LNPTLINLDKHGFIPYKYERGSMVYISNKSYAEWGEVLGDDVITSAVPDRILHHNVT